MTGFEVHVDAAALADMERAEEAARAHAAAMASAGGKATVASHGAQMANGGKAGGKATMSGVLAPRIQSAGGKATMASEHAPGIQSAGGKAGLGRKKGIYKKPHQTAAQAALAAKMRAYRAANRAAGAH